VNDPPVVSQITIAPINEGGTFDPIFLDIYVTDPDGEKNKILWTVTGQINLDIYIDQPQRVALITTPNADWYGSETVTFTATDKSGAGLSDNCVTTITVNPVNDPPVIASGLNQTINHTQNFAQVNLDSYVNDVDNADSEILWSYSGNSELILNITNRVLTISKPYAEWIGSETVTFTASDGDLEDTEIATFSVVYHNDPPVISSIQGETVNENGIFEPIYLDNKVSDPDHSDNQLIWTIHGANHLEVEGLMQRIVHIAPADTEWAGSETLTFIVSDPGGLKDSTQATYTIIAVNDPPKINPMPNIVFNEDTTFTLTVAELKLLVSDPDNEFEELQFSLGNNTHTFLNKNGQTGDLIFSADPNWFGVEDVIFNVMDNQYAMTSQQLRIVVNSKPDAPMAFDLLEPWYGTFYTVTPPSIKFVWQTAVDPDKDDVVTYTWNLSREPNFEHIIDQYNGLTDTFKVYTVPADFYAGVHYWQVIAYDGSGNSTVCNSSGAFNMEQGIDVNADQQTEIPKEFALLPNYPNPFNPETRITYHLPKPCYVSLQIYNGMGQLIRTIVDQNQNAGRFFTYWAGKDQSNEPVASGLYVFKIVAGDFIMAKKMLLLQ